MTGWLYLASLLLVLGCIALVDRRFGLVLWADARRGLAVVGGGVVFFVLWDVAAIAGGFYVRGASPALTGLEVAPHLPVEELVFITFLCYLTLVLHRLLGRFATGRRAGVR